jgi:hypothetical protein
MIMHRLSDKLAPAAQRSLLTLERNPLALAAPAVREPVDIRRPRYLSFLSPTHHPKAESLMYSDTTRFTPGHTRARSPTSYNKIAPYARRHLSDRHKCELSSLAVLM